MRAIPIHLKNGYETKESDTCNYALNGDHYWNTIFLENEERHKKDDLYTVSKFYIEDDVFRTSFMEELKVQGMNYTIEGKGMNVTCGN